MVGNLYVRTYTFSYTTLYQYIRTFLRWYVFHLKIYSLHGLTSPWSLHFGVVRVSTVLGVRTSAKYPDVEHGLHVLYAGYE